MDLWEVMMPRDTAPALARRRNALSVPLARTRVTRTGVARRVWPQERALLRWLYRMAGEPPLALQLWDGSGVGPEPAPYTLRIGDRAAFYQLLLRPGMAFGDLYSAGRLTVRGDLRDLLVMLYPLMDAARERRPAWLEWLWRDRAQAGASEEGARSNIHHHYDLGNAFYRLWLDQAAMQYTCAYFEAPDYTLEEAQLAKLEHVCRKLRLRPGQTVVEAGCGWGGLARYMARHYGVTVLAFNISEEQIRWAREQAEREGLAGQVTYVQDDYRQVGRHLPAGGCDAFVSVGMLEHVGPAHYQALADTINSVLKPEGIGLIHSIGRNRPRPINGWIERRIFPGSYVPSPVELMRIFEGGRFSVLDIENLRLHYARTLDHWLERFMAHQEQVASDYDDSFLRAWQLYLAGSSAAFTTGALQLFQVVFAPAGANNVQSTRRHLYRHSALQAGAERDG